MGALVEFAAVPVEILLGIHIYEGLFSEHRRPYAAFIYYAAWFVVGELGTFFLPVPWLRSSILFLLAFVGNYVTYRTKPLPCLYNTALYFLVIVFSDVLCAAALTAAGQAPGLPSHFRAPIYLPDTEHFRLLQELLRPGRRRELRDDTAHHPVADGCQYHHLLLCENS